MNGSDRPGRGTYWSLLMPSPVVQVHSRKVRMGPDTDLDMVARSTAGFSGAELANVLNEAAMLAARWAGSWACGRLLTCFA